MGEGNPRVLRKSQRDFRDSPWLPLKNTSYFSRVFRVTVLYGEKASFKKVVFSNGLFCGHSSQHSPRNMRSANQIYPPERAEDERSAALLALYVHATASHTFSLLPICATPCATVRDADPAHAL